jgi:hypothetical protein
MKGVQYLFDKKGKAQAVLIDLKKNRQLWEDFQDLMIARQRLHEPREGLDQVKAMLKKNQKDNAEIKGE